MTSPDYTRLDTTAYYLTVLDGTLHERDTTGHGVTALEPTGSHDTRPNTSQTKRDETAYTETVHFTHATPPDGTARDPTLPTWPYSTAPDTSHTRHHGTSRDRTRPERDAITQDTSHTRPDWARHRTTAQDTSQTERGGTPRKKQGANGASPSSEGTHKAVCA